ncbi:hypothetical protein GGS21DRAFT_327885 [Xylaria nigripes]|nr:hypothetical protein GGS21DRAFT_327885 [Xylaria nigripes]
MFMSRPRLCLVYLVFTSRSSIFGLRSDQLCNRIAFGTHLLLMLIIAIIISGISCQVGKGGVSMRSICCRKRSRLYETLYLPMNSHGLSTGHAWKRQKRD